jgi:uncharacterized protein involved in exopolysaccharide biosynthesis
MERYINTFFRFAPILFIPVIILPLVLVFIGLNTKPKHEAVAALVVEQALYLSEIDVVGGSDWESPAQKHGSYLIELLTSRDFLTKVVERTSLKNGLDDPKTRTELLTLANSVSVDNSNFRIVRLNLVYDEPGVAKEFLQATIDEFFARIEQRTNSQATVALEFYRKRAKDAEATFTKAEEELKRFVADNQGKLGGAANGGNGGGVTQEDLQYANFLEVRNARYTEFVRSNEELSSTELAYAGYTQSRSNNFRILDQVEEEAQTSSRFRTVLTMGAVGLIGGGLLLVAGVLLLTWADASYRERSTLARQLSTVPVFIHTLPQIKAKKPKRKTSPYELRGDLVNALKPAEPTHLEPATNK